MGWNTVPYDVSNNYYKIIKPHLVDGSNCIPMSGKKWYNGVFGNVMCSFAVDGGDSILGGNVIITGDVSCCSHISVKGDINVNGVITAPTPNTNDSSTKLATTEWVKSLGYASSGSIPSVSGYASKAGDTFTGDITTTAIKFSGATGDTGYPCITARTIPANQGALSERTELIIFHGNDGTNGYGPDTITLRSPAIRLQTYNDPNVTITSDGGCNDRLYITPAGLVGIGTSSPSYKCDVNGAIHANCNNSTSQATAPSGANHGLVISGTKDYGIYPYTMALGVDYSTGYGYINCCGTIYNTGSGVQTLLLNSNGGNIGIGRASASCQFDGFGGRNLSRRPGTDFHPGS